MKHSIHCAGYRGPGNGFDIGSCDCRHTFGSRDTELKAYRDMNHERNIEARIAKAVAIIIDGLPDWDTEAQQNAQSQQTPEAWTQTMQTRISDAIRSTIVERYSCADAMDQEHVRCLALEAALRLITTHQNTDVAKLALNPRMACRRCGAAPECDVAFDRYNLGTVPKVDCLATK